MVENEQNSGSSGQEKSFKEMTPDEVYEKTHQAAGKGVAAAAGSIQGVTDKMEEKDLAGKTTQALEKTGETTRQVAGTGVKEFQKTKEHVKSQGESGSSP